MAEHVRAHRVLSNIFSMDVVLNPWLNWWYQFLISGPFVHCLSSVYCVLVLTRRCVCVCVVIDNNQNGATDVRQMVAASIITAPAISYINPG